MKTLSTIVCITLLVGCGLMPGPTKQEFANADFGRIDYSSRSIEDVVRSQRNFFDPYSARINCGKANKTYWEGQYGWVAVCIVNAKNRLGAYTGAQRREYLVKDFQLLHVGDRF
jgi:hypothetical protein